jgi:hypothetical protein
MIDPDPQLAPFLDLATRRLADDPQARDEARHELLVRLVSVEDAGAAATRLTEHKPGRTWVHPAIAFSALIVFGALAAFFIRGTIKEMHPLVQFHGGALAPEQIEITSKDQHDFVTARLDSNASTVLHNLERLVHERPNDPGLFEEYTGQSIASLHKLPQDYRETWQRLDPGNGAWLLRESMMKASDAFKGNGGSGPVTDEIAFTDALALLKQAADAERFEIHATDLRCRRLELTSGSESLAGEAKTVIFSISNLDTSLRRIQQFLGALIAEKAKRLTAAKDPEGLRDLIATWRTLSHRLGTRSSTLLDSAVALGFTAKGKEALLQATRDLGMAEEQKQFDAVDRLNTAAMAIFRGSPHRKTMSWLGGGSGLASPPPDVAANPALFDPGRRVEFAVADRLFALTAAALCLLPLAVAGIESIRRGKVRNALADGLAPLFRPLDAAWILALGLLAPGAYYWIITRLTPFGCRDIGMLYYSWPPAPLQALAALLLTWASLLQVIRWRLAKRAAFLGMSQSQPWLGGTFVVVAALLIPAIGGVRWLDKNGEDYLKAMAAACGLPVLWLVWQAGLVLFAPHSGALPGILLARKAIIPLVLLAGTLLASIPVLHQLERHWLRQDQLGRVDRQSGGLIMAEDRAVRWIAEGFEKAFGPQS